MSPVERYSNALGGCGEDRVAHSVSSCRIARIGPQLRVERKGFRRCAALDFPSACDPGADEVCCTASHVDGVPTGPGFGAFRKS